MQPVMSDQTPSSPAVSQEEAEAAVRGADFVIDVREADERTVARAAADKVELGVRFATASRGTEDIKLEVARPAAEIDHRKAPTDFRILPMTVVDRFTSAKLSRLPAAYGFTGQTKLLSLLLRHGIIVHRLERGVTAPAEFFQVSDLTVATSAFQGVKMTRLEGTFTPGEVSLQTGDYFVPMNQPLANLAFSILEPESVDGAVAWDFIEPALSAGNPYPIAKLTKPVTAPSRQVSVEWP